MLKGNFSIFDLEKSKKEPIISALQLIEVRKLFMTSKEKIVFLMNNALIDYLINHL